MPFGMRAERLLADHHVDAATGIDAIHVAAELALQNARAGRLTDFRVQTSLLVAGAAGYIGHPFIQLAAVRRIGKPVAAVLVTGDVVRRVQPLAVKRIGDHGNRTVVLVAHDPTARMFTGQLAALVIECVAVAVARRLAEHGDAAVVFDPAHLPVVGNVAPDQILALAVPRRPLAPHAACPQPLNRRVADAQRIERRIVRDDVGIRIRDGLRKIARRVGNNAWGLGLLRRLPARSPRAAQMPPHPQRRLSWTKLDDAKS